MKTVSHTLIPFFFPMIIPPNQKLGEKAKLMKQQNILDYNKV